MRQGILKENCNQIVGTKDYDSPFCRDLVFCTQFKNTFALSILTYPQKQHSQTGVCCYMCMSANYHPQW